MKIPQLRKKPDIKSCHNTSWEDNYSWIHQNNILDVLKDSSKLLPEVKKYLEEENAYTEYHLENTKQIQKELFNEIKGRIKLDDESLPYKDRDHALFVAFAPYKDPQYAISVLVEHGGSGGKAAAPIAKKVIKKVLERHELRRRVNNQIGETV